MCDTAKYQQEVPVPNKNDTPLMVLLLFISLGLMLAGFFSTSPAHLFEGFINIQKHHGRLLSDFTVIGGTGAALVNAGLMGLFSLLVIKLAKVSISGPTFAAVFTIIGFSLFGKTILNAVPIVCGVFISAKIARKELKSYLLIALFGTALGPLVSFIMAHSGLPGPFALVAGSLAGIVTGILLPPIAMAMLRLHEGFSLYNVGFACGFLGLFLASILVAFQLDISTAIIWNTVPSPLLMLLVPVISLMLILIGISMDTIKNNATNFLKIQKLPGRLPTNFMDNASTAASLINAGVLGLLGSLYLWLIGADFNGPTLGGLFTVIGFATFGKHLRNTWPVVAGVITATLLFGKSLTAPVPVLALLFGTTLAPIGGEMGIIPGFIAGFLHLLLVDRTASWHGGLDLYNNGFSGGLVATLMLALSEWIKSNRETK